MDLILLEDSKVLDSWTLQIFSNNPNEGPQGNFFARVVTLANTNKAPTWTSSAPNRRVSEGLPLSFQLKASDADLPPQPLTFSLVSGPDGLTINPTSGLVSFRPTEAQGPSTNTVVVRVSDNGTPALSAAGVLLAGAGGVAGSHHSEKRARLGEGRQSDGAIVRDSE
jgi:hypothetical protein